jgi:hypothetical protein
MALILCNIYFADNKLTTKQLLISVVWGLLPFLNAIFLVLIVMVAWNKAVEEASKDM